MLFLPINKDTQKCNCLAFAKTKGQMDNNSWGHKNNLGASEYFLRRGIMHLAETLNLALWNRAKLEVNCS